MSEVNLEKWIRDIPDFPKPGILFKDITPLLEDAEGLKAVIDLFADRYRGTEITKVVGVEARGFIFGAALAYALGLGFSVVRKPGKLPYQTVGVDYALEYGTDRLEMHIDALSKDDKVLIIDDLLATGGTAAATVELVKTTGAEVVEVAFVIELAFLKGGEKIDAPVFSLLSY